MDVHAYCSVLWAVLLVRDSHLWVGNGGDLVEEVEVGEAVDVDLDRQHHHHAVTAKLHRLDLQADTPATSSRGFRRCDSAAMAHRGLLKVGKDHAASAGTTSNQR